MQFLILARVAQGVSIEQVMPHVKVEAEAVWQQYSAEILRSMHLVIATKGGISKKESHYDRNQH